MTFHLIGQAPPKLPYPKMPFGKSKLYEWLKQAGFEDFTLVDNREGWNSAWSDKSGNVFAFDAVYPKFPGSLKRGHVAPNREMIVEYKSYLVNSLKEINSDIIVPIGKLAISYCLDENSYNKKPKELKLNDTVGKKFISRPFGLVNEKKVIIPLPHPSGASTWFYKKENMKLLNNALRLIEQ